MDVQRRRQKVEKVKKEEWTFWTFALSEAKRMQKLFRIEAIRYVVYSENQKKRSPIS
jgi:hypothetical protein